MLVFGFWRTAIFVFGFSTALYSKFHIVLAEIVFVKLCNKSGCYTFYRYFDCWGFCTGFQTTKRYDECYLVIFVLHIVMDFFAGWSIIVFLKRPTLDTLGLVNDVIKLGSILFVCFLSITESYFKRKTQRIFWLAFQKIEQSYRTKQSYQLQSYLKKFAFFVITSMVSSAYLLSFMYHHPDSIFMENPDFWFTYEFVTKLYQNRVLYYIFYLELVENELQMIEAMAENVAQSGRYFTNSTNNYQTLNHEDNLKRICEYYQLTRELSEELNLVFGWSNAVTILFSFALILTESNWVYWRWYNQFSMVNMIG